MRTLRVLLTVTYVFILNLSGVNADVAYNEQILPASGGDGVAINQEWAFVGDADQCLVYIYKLDYSTMQFGDGDKDGDGTVSAGIPFQTLGTNCNANGFRSFGASISNTGDTLLIGAPGASKVGVIHVYGYDTTTETWVPYTGNQGYAGPGVQGGRFGASVSARSKNDNEVLVVVGAPKDGLTNNVLNNTGKAYAYTFNRNDQTFVLQKQFFGDQAGEEFGFSVTSDGNRTLIGAPFYDGNSSISPIAIPDAGRVYYYSSLASLTPDNIYYGETTNAQRGKELSLSAEYYMLMSGDISTALEGTEDPPSTIIKEFIGANGGDVSQSEGVVSMAVKNESVYVIPNIKDTGPLEPSYAIIIDKPQSNFGEDINIYKEQLLVNGDIANEAYVYDFPCGIKQASLNAAEWTMISIPCDVTGQTVGDVFGNLGSAGTDFIITEQNGTDWSGYTSANVRLSDSDPVSQNKSYWLYLRNAQQWYVDASASSTRTSLSVLSIFNDDRIGGYKIIQLPDSDALSGDNNVTVMAVNPFPRPFYWDNVYVATGQGVSPMNSAAAADVIKDATAYVYDLSVTDGNGQNYRAVTTTPGFTNTIEPYEGFWVKVIDDGVTPNTNVELWLPFEK